MKRGVVVGEQFDWQEVQAIVAGKESLKLFASLNPIGQFDKVIKANIKMVQ